ncbi:hypothetical protein ACFSVK_23895 [Azorhizophilus paspali]
MLAPLGDRLGFQPIITHSFTHSEMREEAEIIDEASASSGV